MHKILIQKRFDNQRILDVYATHIIIVRKSDIQMKNNTTMIFTAILTVRHPSSAFQKFLFCVDIVERKLIAYYFFFNSMLFFLIPDTRLPYSY